MISVCWEVARRKKLTVECYRSLDIRQLAKAGALVVGTWAQCAWQRDGRNEAAVMMRAEEHALWLEYQVRDKPYCFPIALDYTACHYGGQRAWFLCPAGGCGRRVAKLYSSQFVCRQCMDLAYDSQRESESLRVIGRSMQLRKKLKLAPICFWLPAIKVPRPKGMHEDTYQQLLMQLRMNDRRFSAISRSLMGLNE